MKPIEEQLLHRGQRFDVHLMKLAGSDGKLYDREVIRHPGAVVLLPLIDENTIVLIENSRPTVGETLLELPAGTREPGELAEVTANRELIEETGYQAGQLRCLHQFYSAPGISDEWMQLYVATDLTPGRANREAVEQIQNRIVSRDQVTDLLYGGQIRDAKTIVGLYAYLHLPQLKTH